MLIPYERACRELRELGCGITVPGGVYDALRTLSGREKELFVWVGSPDNPVSNPSPTGLYASDFFLSVITALRAREWAKTLSLISGTKKYVDKGRKIVQA